MCAANLQTVFDHTGCPPSPCTTLEPTGVPHLACKVNGKVSGDKVTGKVNDKVNGKVNDKVSGETVAQENVYSVS